LRLFNRKIFIILIIIFTFLITNADFTKNTASNFSITKKFPKSINGWVEQNLKLEKTSEIFKVMSPEDLILRVYKNKNSRNDINLALILTDDKKKVHDPQICYKLQGFEFLDTKNIKLTPNLNVNFIKIKKAKKEYLFIYWYTDLDANYTTRTEFWREIIFKKIMGKPIKAYGIVILYTPIENTANLKKFALKINDILFNQIKNH